MPLKLVTKFNTNKAHFSGQGNNNISVSAQKCCALVESEPNLNLLLVDQSSRSDKKWQRKAVRVQGFNQYVYQGVMKRKRDKWLCNRYHLFHHDPPMSLGNSQTAVLEFLHPPRLIKHCQFCPARMSVATALTPGLCPIGSNSRKHI